MGPQRSPNPNSIFPFFSLDKETKAERKPVGRSRCPSRLLAERTLRSQTGPGQVPMVLTLPVKMGRRWAQHGKGHPFLGVLHPHANLLLSKRPRVVRKLSAGPQGRGQS